MPRDHGGGQQLPGLSWSVGVLRLAFERDEPGLERLDLGFQFEQLGSQGDALLPRFHGRQSPAHIFEPLADVLDAFRERRDWYSVSSRSNRA